MATIQDLSALSQGTTLSSSSSNQQTIIVSGNGTPIGGGCLPCDEGTTCEVAPTAAATLDLSRFSSKNSTVRFIVDTTASTNPTADKILVLFSDLRFGEWNDNFPRLNASFPEPLIGGDTVHNGDTINGVVAGSFLGEFNGASVNGGALLGSVTVQYNSATYPVLDGLTIDAFFLPPDPSDSVIINQELSPLCDYCTSNNNGNFTTHKYVASMPITNRNGVVVTIPGVTGGVVVTLDLCFPSNGIPNNQQATWENQA